jgi:hypothetical protein
MPKAVKVTPLEGYKLRIQYADGVEGEVDLSHLAGKGVFALWNDANAFRSVYIGPSGQIKWNEEVDLCPDALYLEITEYGGAEASRLESCSTDAAHRSD